MVSLSHLQSLCEKGSRSSRMFPVEEEKVAEREPRAVGSQWLRAGWTGNSIPLIRIKTKACWDGWQREAVFLADLLP